MNTENIAILEDDLEFAHSVCASIEDSSKRSKAVANILSARIACRFFDTDIYRVDEESGLHNIASIVDNYEISDIYINDSYINARVYFSDDELCIPKLHYDLGIQPCAYMFIKLSSNLKTATLTGFVTADKIRPKNPVADVYCVPKEFLVPFSDIQGRLYAGVGIKEIEESKLFDLLDNLLSDDDKLDLIKQFLQSKDARIQLLKKVKAKSLFNTVSIPNVEPMSVKKDDSIVTEDDLVELFDVAEQTDDASIYDNLEEIIDSQSDDSGLNAKSFDDINRQQYNSGYQANNSLYMESNLSEDYGTNTSGEPQIESLFSERQHGVPVPGAKKKNNFFVIFMLLILIGFLAFYYYTNYYIPSNSESEETYVAENINEQELENPQSTQTEDAMPVESVDNKAADVNKEEGNALSIPEIEKNLDASVLVANLKVDFEVPDAYNSNTAARRYLVKLGKIIQLNLKSELLLLTKPPLSNKISVEIKFNPTIGCFEVVGIQASSGEKTIDDAILQTVSSALKLKVTSNIDTFTKMQANPLIIIHL